MWWSSSTGLYNKLQKSFKKNLLENVWCWLVHSLLIRSTLWRLYHTAYLLLSFLDLSYPTSFLGLPSSYGTHVHIEM